MTSAQTRRIIAFFIDGWIIAVVEFLILFMLNVDITNNYILERPVLFVSITIPLILLKDVFGRSLGKRVLGLQIIRTDVLNGRPTVWQLLCRNITTMIWPFEAVNVLYISKDHQRYMDRLLKIAVV